MEYDNQTPMIKASYHQEYNALILEFKGVIDAAQMKGLLPDIEKLLPKDGKGFKILTDLSGVEEVKHEIREPVKRMMDFLDDQGVTEIIRVIPDPAQDIGLNVMSPFHYSKDVKFATVQSREEALARLAE